MEQAQQELDWLQDQMNSVGCTDLLLDKEKEAQINLHTALRLQEEFWREKSRLNWHSFGYRNTAYFHIIAKIRGTSKQMSILKDGEAILDKQEDIENHVVQYYRNLFASPNSCTLMISLNRLLLLWSQLLITSCSLIYPPAMKSRMLSLL